MDGPFICLLESASGLCGTFFSSTASWWTKEENDMRKYYAFVGLAVLVVIGLFGASIVSAAPAGAATGLRVTQEGCTGGLANARLSWTPSGKGDQRVDLSATNNGFASGYSSGTTGSSGGVMVFTQLKPGTTYYARVVTQTGSGPISSDTVQFTASCTVTAFTAPNSLQAANSDSGQVRFLWNPGQNNKWFCIDTARNVADLMGLKGTWRNYCRTDANNLTVSGLHCGATYVWAVYAWNGGLNAKSAPSTIQTPPCVIGKPTNLDFRQTGNDSVRLSWRAGENNRWYCVDVAESEKDLKNFGSTWENFGCWQPKTSLDLVKVECGKVYYFNVYAWNEDVNARSANSSFQLKECTAQVPAEIVSLSIEKSETTPIRYYVKVVAVLPNGCYSPDSHKVSRDNRTFNIKVLNLLEQEPKCVKGEKTYELEIFFANDLQSGKRYTVNVNGETIKFTAD
jgi:hypothetical protein